MESHFTNLEKVDGYFSGTMNIKGNNGDLFVVELGYDIDTRKLDLWKCKALLSTSVTGIYEPYDVAEFCDRFGSLILDDIYGTLIWRYGPQKSFVEYEAEAYQEEFVY